MNEESTTPEQNLSEDNIEKPVIEDKPQNISEDDNLNSSETLPLEISSGENAEDIETSPEAENIDSIEETLSPETESLESLEEIKNRYIQNISELQAQKQTLETEIETLKKEKDQLLSDSTVDIQQHLNQIVETSLEDLQQRRQKLQTSIEKLERRRERIREEMRTTYAGVSQDLAIRVQGFKDYLVGSLQDLTAAAEQLELSGNQQWGKSSNFQESKIKKAPVKNQAPQPQFSEQNFQQETRKIKSTLEKYRTRPDYYGAPWQLRRTFEPIHSERVNNWFFSQGGRGALKSMGSRLQNILVASTIMSVLHRLYGNRSRTLVLANTPERLGEWRRGLQDCLGISRSDFGPEKGVVLFEQPQALIQKAERLVKDKLLPLVVIDETEDHISLSLLQFPLWLAFAPETEPNSNYYF